VTVESSHSDLLHALASRTVGFVSMTTEIVPIATVLY
jgi:hypothetical protein